MKWHRDERLQGDFQKIIKSLGFSHINSKQVHCYRTYGSKARAYARIWSFPKIFQEVLNVKPAYIIEVLSEKFDKLSEDNKSKVLIHELLHIPKNFSGALLPYKTRGRRIGKEVDKLFKMMKSNDQ